MDAEYYQDLSESELLENLWFCLKTAHSRINSKTFYLSTKT